MITMSWSDPDLKRTQWCCLGSVPFPDGSILAHLVSVEVKGKADTVYIARDLGIRSDTADQRDADSAIWTGSNAKSLYRLIQANEWAIKDKLKIRRV